MAKTLSAPRPAAPAAPRHPETQRKLMIAVRAACRRKGIDDDDRRAIQLEITGQESMATMSTAQLGKLLDHLNRDWTRPAGDRPHLGKIRALWWSLYWLGAIHRPDDEALSSFISRQTGIERLRFLDHRKAPAVIEALKSWLEREGVFWWSASDIDTLSPTQQALVVNTADRHAVLLAIGNRLYPNKSIYDFTFAAFRLQHHSPWPMTATELDAAIRHFGKILRQRVEAQP